MMSGREMDVAGQAANMNPYESEIASLKQSVLFAGLGADELKLVAVRLQKRTYPANTIIAKEGTPGDAMFIIKKGQAQQRKNLETTNLREGACFGEIELASGAQRTATVTTMVTTEVFLLDKKNLQELMLGSSAIAACVKKAADPRSGGQEAQGARHQAAEHAHKAHDAGTKQHGGAKPDLMSMTNTTRIEEASSPSLLSSSGDWISLDGLDLQTELLALIPQQVILEHKMLPISYSGNKLTLAMVNPRNILAFDHVRKYVRGATIDTVAMNDSDFQTFMKVTYPRLMLKGKDDGKSFGAKDPFGKKDPLKKDPLGKDSWGKDAWNKDPLAKDPLAAKDGTGPLDGALDLMQDLEMIEERDDGGMITELEKEAGHAPIIRLANNIIALALRRQASDIHLEPGEKGLRVRFRVDGVLREEQVLPKKVYFPLVSRFKIISRLDITERRIPQDGRISLKVSGKMVDFRVSTVPTKYGEKITIRILDKESQVFGLERLITSASTLELVRQMIKKPYGIVYVTGPTGSGKTTTLYSALAELNKPDVNILTVEDPIEYDLAGINQVQVNADIGLDFARVLRAFLRQDPDIMLVGETRDKETAKIAVEAALTGHLVFTTLHTNDAPSAFVRLIEMGIEPFLISTSIIGIIAQRLVRKICPQCRVAYDPDDVTIGYLGLRPGMQVYRGEGCDACNGSGYKGRLGVYEVLMINEELRHMIGQGAGSEQIRDKAVEIGFQTLRNYSLILLEEGLTTVDEVLRTVAIEA